MTTVSSAAGSPRHRSKPFPFTASVEPGLSAVAEDLHGRLIRRRVVERADKHHDDALHDLCFRQHAGSAVRTEPPEHRLPGISGVRICLQLALYGDRARRIRRDSLEARSGIPLAVAAMAQAGEHRIAG